jgi:hypothetical protein
MGLLSFDADIGHVVVGPRIGVAKPDDSRGFAWSPHRRIGREVRETPGLDVAPTVFLELIHVVCWRAGYHRLQ